MSANKLESRSAAAPQTTFTTRRVARTCHNADCGKNPYFGWHGEKAIFCVAHKEPGELNSECGALELLSLCSSSSTMQLASSWMVVLYSHLVSRCGHDLSPNKCRIRVPHYEIRQSLLHNSSPSHCAQGRQTWVDSGNGLVQSRFGSTHACCTTSGHSQTTQLGLAHGSHAIMPL